MDSNSYDAYTCPVDKTIQLISGKWKPIILYLIQHDINRFSSLQKKMPGISKKVLTEQLRDLESQYLIIREVKISKHPQEVVYSLLPRGVSLRKLIDEIFYWGTDNLLDETEKTRVKRLAFS